MKGVLLIALCVLALAANTGYAMGAPAFGTMGKQAVFLSPVERFHPTWHLEEYTSVLERAGYSLNVLLNEDVSLSLLSEGLGSYDIIILKTDSFTYQGTSYYCSGERVTPETRTTYAGEISKRELHVGACLGFSLMFLYGSYQPDSLRPGLVLMVDGYAEDLASVFIAGGSKVFVSYYNAYSLSWGLMDAYSIKWLKYMADGLSVKQATGKMYAYLTSGHGNIVSWPTIFWYGDGNFKI